MGVGHAQFLTLIDVRGAAVHVQHQAKCLGRTDAGFLRGVVAPAGDHARLIMIAGEQAGPSCVLHGSLVTGHNALEFRQVKRQRLPLGTFAIKINMLEQEEHVQFTVARISDVLVTLSRDAWRLAHSQEAFTPLEYLTSHFSQEFILTGAVRTERIRVGIALLAHRKILKLRAVLARQLAVRIGALGDQGDDVHAEAVDASVKPPVHHVVHSAAHGRVLPVEVRLLLRELMQEVFATLGAVFPCGAAKVGAPLIGLGAGLAGRGAGTSRTPPIPVGVFVVFVLGCFKPGVFIGSVIDNKIHHDLEPTLVGLGQQLVHIVERAEQRINVLIVGNIVAIVVLRRLVYRG